MAYTKPDTAISDWTDEELSEYENHLKRVQKLDRIKELEKEKKDTSKPKLKVETSEKDDIDEDAFSSDDTLDEFDKIYNEKE